MVVVFADAHHGFLGRCPEAPEEIISGDPPACKKGITMKEKIILSICSRAMAIMSTETTLELRRILEAELYVYDISVSCTALVPYEGPPEKLRLFLASKRLDGLSPLTLERYGARLTHFCRTMQKKIEDIDSMDIRAYLAAYAQTGVMASTIATAQTALKSFFGWLMAENLIVKSRPMGTHENEGDSRRI
jgi:integrase/recombinase XerD